MWKSESSRFNEERKLYAEVAKSYGRNESSIGEIVKKEKDIHASFAVAPQTAKLWPQYLISA